MAKQKEIWLPITGYEGYYEISNIGNVRSINRWVKDRRGRKMVRGKDKLAIIGNNGYYSVSLYKFGEGKTYLVHRLIAIHFIPNPNNKPFINHKDSNKLNNSIDNLEWCTNQENIIHASQNGKIGGDNHYACRIKKADKDRIKQLSASGTPQYKIAEIFKTSRSHISRIVNNKTKRSPKKLAA